MSLYLDQKYLSLISNRLPLFKRKDDNLYNCRCILCGDSLKNKRKARGYFFSYKNELRYKCHNCDASMAFSSFLKNLDSLLFSQYSLEKYSEGRPISISNSNIAFEFTEPKFKNQEEKLLDKLLDSLDKLPEDNEAVQYCMNRKIPYEKFNQLYYIQNIKDIVQLNDKYKESIQGEESRLVLPFYDNNGQLSGVTCRALHGEALRYITVKIKENTPLIFGLDNVDRSKPLFVVEGPIDSLFINNSIAVAGVSFNKMDTLGLDKDKLVLVIDNQPRNKDVCRVIDSCITKGYNVVIWPQHIEAKDINEMVLAGLDVNSIVNNNVFSGLTAKAKFIAWKRC